MKELCMLCLLKFHIHIKKQRQQQNVFVFSYVQNRHRLARLDLAKYLKITGILFLKMHICDVLLLPIKKDRGEGKGLVCLYIQKVL